LIETNLVYLSVATKRKAMAETKVIEETNPYKPYSTDNPHGRFMAMDAQFGQICLREALS
jgi:hypothetical protein